jgi:hypothetical protein
MVLAGRTRRAAVAGMLVAVIPIPLLGRPEIISTAWALAGGFHLVALLLAGYLLLRARRVPDAHRGGHRWAAITVLGGALIVGLVVWLPALDQPGPGDAGTTVRSAAEVAAAAASGGPSWLEPGRWAFATGLALVAASLGPLFVRRDPVAVAVGGVLLTGAVGALAAGIGSPPAAALVAAAAVVAPAAACVAVSLTHDAGSAESDATTPQAMGGPSSARTATTPAIAGQG